MVPVSRARGSATLGYSSPSAEWVPGTQLSSHPHWLWDPVTDNCPLLLAAPELGWAPGQLARLQRSGLVAGALLAFSTQKPSGQ
jgi:hypothetical protein